MGWSIGESGHYLMDVRWWQASASYRAWTCKTYSMSAQDSKHVFVFQAGYAQPEGRNAMLAHRDTQFAAAAAAHRWTRRPWGWWL